MTTTEIIAVAAGVLLAVGAICYWRASSAANAGGDVQKDFLSALRRDRRLEPPGGNGATGWGAA